MRSKDETLTQAKHLLLTQKLIWEEILKRKDFGSILGTLCLQMEKIISPSICAILLSSDQTKTKTFRMAPSGSIAFCADLDEFDPHEFLEISDMVISQDEVLAFPEVETNAGWSRIHHRINKYGIQSWWSIPIGKKNQQPMGTLVIFHEENHRPSTFEIYALNTAAQLAELAIEQRQNVLDHSTNRTDRFQNLFDSAPVAYLTSTMEGKILSANACAAMLTGLEPDELPGRSELDLYAPTLRGKRKAERLHHWIQHGLEVEKEELELERPDGTRRWVSLTVGLIRDSLGNPIERRSILEDISNQKQAQQLLDEQKSILEMIAKGQPLAHTLLRLCEGIETLTPGIQCAIHQLHNTTLHLLAAPSLPRSYAQTIDGMKIGVGMDSCGTAAYRREPVIVSDIATDPLWHQSRTVALDQGFQACWAIPIVSSDNEVLGTLAMYCLQPRTPCQEDWQIIEASKKLAGIALEQERDRLALQQSEARFRTLYEDNPTMYFTVALNGTVRSVNQFGASQLGFSPDELRGTSVFSLCHPDDLSIVRQTFDAYLHDPSDLENLEFRHVRKDGTVIWVRETIRLIHSKEQEPVLFLVCEDITNQKLTSETLIASEEAIRKLYDITSSPNLDFEARIRALLQLGCERFHLSSGLLAHGVGEDLTLQYIHTPSSSLVEGTTVPMQHTFWGLTIGSPEPIGIEQISELSLPTSVCHSTFNWQSYLGTKVMVGHETYGILCFGSPQVFKGKFSEAEKDFLQLMARWIGTELEQIQAREALEKNHAVLHAVLEGSIDAFYVKNLQGSYLMINSAGARLLGKSPSEVIGKNDFDLLSTEQAIAPRQKDLEILASQQSQTFEEQVTISNVTRTYLTTKSPFYDSAGNIIGIFGNARDITERKRGEEALQLTQQVFDILPDHVSVVGPDYRYRRVNTAYEQVHGLPAQDIIGKHISDLLGQEIFQRDIQPLFNRCLQGESVSYERWFQFHDGYRRFMAVTYSPLWDQDHHQVEAVVVNARDLTPRKHMEEALKESEGRLRVLLDERIRISQDLHDHVLQSIYAVGLMIAAIRKPLETQNFSEVYEFLDQAVLQVNNSITDIRGFIEGLPKDLDDIGDFSTELTNLVQSMSIPDGPTFQLRLDQEALDLLCQQNTLHLVNIARESMSNCLRHAQATESTISLTRENGHLRFEIADNGIGFIPLERSHAGHGLINMKARSEHLQGTMTIRSAPHEGTRVIIHMPTAAPNRGK
ncbi:PAS domain S-box protein [Candidatus Nitronereus thalassa]|uniref:histidine kinase n=1 Tax=Candidatus Nitronereus thalassa TaxID=3020898 RepID=A0ABU3KBX3_9BACT|nr:PAS domain S-box protein [Candidatus Nitronereus thalassa]MDT7044015.1 PAS domain S-box protein [Candidatus Nitronereus thalassa]